MGKKKILLVDDSETQLLYEKMMLGNEFETRTAKNGRLALETLKADKPDLILLDILMPESDGIECLKAIRAQKSTKTIPVIMVTTKSDKSRVEACYQLGANDFITKPVGRSELLSKVHKFLKGDS